MDQLSLENVDHKQLFRLMQIVLSAGQSLMIRGGVGIGKTMSVYDYAAWQAKRMGRELKIWIDMSSEERTELAHNDELLSKVYLCSIFDTLNKLPEDTGGIPVPVNGFIEWKPPVLFYILSKPQAAGVLFLDELLQAQQAVQKPLSDLFLNKQISDRRLSDDVCVVAASNERHDKCGTIEMLEHMKNRMSHCTLVPPDARGWVQWARTQDKVNADGSIEPYIDPRVTMFIMSCPDMLYAPVTNRKGDAYPTPRGWHKLSDLIKGISEEKDKQLFLRLVATRVGSGGAAKFKAVLDHNMAEHGPEIQKDPELFRNAPWDRRVAFSMWMSTHSKGDSKFMHRSCRFLDELGENDMLDTLLYMMKSTVGTLFLTAARGNRYPQLQEALIAMADGMQPEV